MIERKTLVARAGIAALAACMAFAGAAQAQQTEELMEKAVDERMDYLLYLPADYEDAGEADYPLVVFLHGGGAETLDIVAEGGPPRLVAEGREFPFILLSPRNPHEELFFPIQTVATLIDEVIATHRVDEDRVYLVGYSRGAFSAWLMAEQYPDLFAAVVAVSGGGIPHYLNRVKDTTPFWVFHGARDDVIPLSASVEMVERLQQIGGERDIKFTVYSEAGHGEAPELAFSDPELYDWLLQQERQEQQEQQE